MPKGYEPKLPAKQLAILGKHMSFVLTYPVCSKTVVLLSPCLK